MFKSEIIWHDASEELPNKSCEVVVACERDGRINEIFNIDYSSRHKKFNCLDYYSEDTADKYGCSNVKYWAYFDEVCSQFQKHEKKTAENGNSQTVNKK